VSSTPFAKLLFDPAADREIGTDVAIQFIGRRSRPKVRPFLVVSKVEYTRHVEPRPAWIIGRCALIGLLVSLSGQEPSRVQESDKPAVRVTTRMVQVGVVVHRGSGPLTGLTKEDFQVFDNGKEQRIAALSGGMLHNASEANRGTANPAIQVSSNRADKAAPGLTVVLLDALNTPPSEMVNAKAQVIRCFNQIQGNSSIALYALGGKLVVLHDFTQNIAHLRQVLEEYRAGSLPVFDLNPGRSGLSPNGATAGTPLDRMAAQANTELGAVYAASRAQVTLHALEAIAVHLRPIPGRKNLIWLSSAFPVSIAHIGGRQSFRDETRRLSQTLTDADVAVYPVHTRGLVGVPSADSNARAARRAGANLASTTVPASMQTLADETGGKAYYGTNDLSAAVQKALSDSEGNYTIGFYPPEESLDGKFHELRVRVNLRGVDIRSRRGYFATPESSLTPEQRQARLNEAVASPFESTAIPMKVRLDPADQPKPGSFRVIVGIDLNGLSLTAQGDRRVGRAEMMLVQQSADGRRLQASDETIKLDLPPDEFKRMSTDGLVLVKYVEPAVGLYQIRVYVLDSSSGALGSVYAPVAHN
jgi:VWFA-related protein